MPWNPAQHRLFEAAAHNPQIAAQHHMPQAKAVQMASEGVKSKPKQLAAALRKR